MSPVYVSKGAGSNYEPHPTGQFVGRCIDVIDLGWSKGGQYGPKYQTRIVMFAGEYIEREVEGEVVQFPMTVQSTFTATLDERGRLRPFLEGWRGKDFTEEEEEKFDLEKLLGAPALMTVVHNESGDRTYANIKGIVPVPKAMRGDVPDAPKDYERVMDRNGWEGPRPHPDMGEPVDAGQSQVRGEQAQHQIDDADLTEPDDDLPF